MDYVENIRTDKGDLPVMASAIKEGTPIPGLEGVGEDVAKLKTDTAELIGNVDAITATQKEQGRILSALWDLNEGKTYRFEEDSTPAYSKTMPSGARMTDINMNGGKTIVWNQMWVSKNSTSGGITKTTNTDGYSVFNGTPTSTSTSLGSSINAIVGHKYYTKVTGSGVAKCWTVRSAYNVIRGANEQYPGQGIIKECSDNSHDQNYIQLYFNADVVFDNDTFYGTIVDLTAMFGAGNEPTAEEFEAMFPAEYYPYSEPTLLSADVDKVVSRSKNLIDGTNEITIPIPEAIRNLPGYGWSAGSVYNEVDFKNRKFINKVKYARLNGSEKWSTTGTVFDDTQAFQYKIELQGQSNIGYRNIISNKFEDKKNGAYASNVVGIANYITSSGQYIRIRVSKSSASTLSEFTEYLSSNPVDICYELFEPIITDISDILDSIDVEAGGTLTFENTHGDDFRIPVPNTTETVVKLSEVTA